MRWFYPIDWPQISRHVRFERAGGSCQGCGRPHGETIRCLPDGRWYDATRQTWRNGRGQPARCPDVEEATRLRQTRVVLAAAHLDHDPGNNRPRTEEPLPALPPIHDRPHHQSRRRITLPAAPGARRPVPRPLLRLTLALRDRSCSSGGQSISCDVAAPVIIQGGNIAGRGGDNRGRIYHVTNLRTHQRWREADASQRRGLSGASRGTTRRRRGSLVANRAAAAV